MVQDGLFKRCCNGVLKDVLTVARGRAMVNSVVWLCREH